MEKKIREYEAFIKKAAKRPTPELQKYHSEMLKNFQHERLIHLIITLFFSGITIVFLCATFWLSFYFTWWMTLPLLIASLTLAIISGFYIKHYYFLENHIQSLYTYTKIMMAKPPKNPPIR